MSADPAPDDSPRLPAVAAPLPGDRAPGPAAGVVYAAVFSVLGAHGPYFPVFLASRGLEKSEIAMIIGAPQVLRLLVTPLVGRLADSRPDRRPLMAVLLLVTMAAAVAVAGLSGFGPILLCATVMMLAFQPVPPLMDATVGSLVRRGVVRDFGRLRLWGSISFAFVAVFCGFLLNGRGIDAVFIGYIALLVVALGSLRVLPSAQQGERAGGLAGPFRLWRRPALCVVLLAVGLINASQAMFFSFGSVHMLALGYPDWSIGVLWTVAVVAEVVVLWFAPSALARLGPYRLLLLAAGCTLVRWLGMALDPPLMVTGLLQMLHAGTMSCTYLGTMAFVQALVEDEASARAQSASVTLTGLMTAGMTLLTGPIYQALGGKAYLAAAILPALAVLLLALSRRRLSGPMAVR